MNSTMRVEYYTPVILADASHSPHPSDAIDGPKDFHTRSPQLVRPHELASALSLSERRPLLLPPLPHAISLNALTHTPLPSRVTPGSPSAFFPPHFVVLHVCPPDERLDRRPDIFLPLPSIPTHPTGHICLHPPSALVPILIPSHVGPNLAPNGDPPAIKNWASL
ncbi:hypothetical protein FA13DRAFT_294982 [Coprinellus micaceus]|uniref:Uncharacterized protein n=1 Tax=Coprinellus micaceus TaxID=71717 RepID=A0A4Y7SEK1_COPMI|nr:hypothetical protein FA13DRAFT_294982 [Coprinellus micaceus]